MDLEKLNRLQDTGCRPDVGNQMHRVQLGAAEGSQIRRHESNSENCSGFLTKHGDLCSGFKC